MVVACVDFASEYEISDKMLVVYKELTLVKSKVAKSQFYSQTKSKRGKIARKIHYQQHLVPHEFVSVGLDDAVRIRDKQQVVYKEMTRNGAKCNVAKYNF